MSLSLRSFLSQIRVSRICMVLALALAEAGCGDTFRPVAIPLPPVPPNPSSLHYVLALSVNGPFNPGASTRVDVSGDTSVAAAQMGLEPVHAVLLPSGGSVYVANYLEDTVSFYNPSVTGPVFTVTLPSGSNPSYLAATDNTTVYVANSTGNNVVAISTANNVITRTISVAPNPVALAEMPNAQKLYVASQGTGAKGSVSSINTVDGSANSITGAAWNSPVWVVARGDNARVYALDQGTGLVSAIDTVTDAVVGSVNVQAGANYMVYNASRNRLYVINPVAATLTVLDVTTQASGPTDPLNVLQTISFATSSAANAACGLPNCSPVSVAALRDGSRVYVSSFGDATCSQSGDTPPCISAQVTVINAANNTVTKTIPIILGLGTSSRSDTPRLAACDSARFRLSAAGAADSTRVYVGYCDAGALAVIRTTPNTSPGSESAGDYLVNNLKAPVSAGAPMNNGQPPPQNPVFVLAGP